MANSQTFTLNFDAKLNVAQMKGAIGNIQSELNRLQLPQNLTRGITGTLTSLEKELRNFEVTVGKDLSQKNNFSAFERSAERISSLFKDLEIQARDLGHGISLDKFFPPDVVDTISKAQKALENYEREVEQLKRKVSSQKGSVTKAVAAQTVAGEDLNAAKEKLNEFATEYQETLTNLFKKVKIDPKNIIDQASIDQAISEAQNRIKRLQQIQNDKNANDKTYKYADSTKEKAKAEEAALTGLIEKYNQLREAQTQQSQTIQKLQTAYDAATNRVRIAQTALQQLEDVAKAGTADALSKLIAELNKLGIDTSGVTSLDQAKAALEAYAQVARGDAAAALQKLNDVIREESEAAAKNKEDVDAAAKAHENFNDSMREVNALKSRIQYFFGLNNAINLVRRAIRGAVETVKELDAAMTETAVVTNYTIADMWEQLPEYTKRANELGVTTKDAYESATLYFQQGLNADQAAALSTETLKMARIAGLEAAEATDRMTNALRGFNMELDAVNAQRVDDVYSQLAAMSASNVDEISTAMTKVASLAHSANMEFETTAAFLAQIIETTRESAETAGTALKTVVARFSEVKKLYSIDELKGTDEEGQGIDVNKISTALRTAGIDLNKYFLGEVGLDDIFMELASKWDSLTGVQQRYIATQAAGSRQQSRFIALMQDYARMQELVGAAYSSTGASAKQFEKTQDSLQSKLARLKNAWNEFLMGLANNDVIKIAVDVLTNLINGLNNLTSALGKNIGSLLKWIAVVSAFKGVKGLFSTNGPVDRILAGMMGSTLGRQNADGAGGGPVSGSTTWNGANWIAPQRRGLFFNFGQRRQGRINAFDEIQAQGTGQLGAGAGLFGQLGSKLASRGLGKRFAGTKAAGSLAKLLGFGSASGGAAAGGAGAAAAAGLAAALTGVAIAATAAAVAYGAWYALSPEGQLKQATKYAKVMAETATNAKKAAEEVKKAQESYKKYNVAVEEANTIDEKSKAIEDRNSYIASLIEQNKEFAQYVTAEQKDNQFVLTINEEALENAVKDISTKAVNAEIASSFANAMQAGLQADVYGARRRRANVNLKDNIIGPEGAARTLTNAERAKYLQEFQAENISRKEQLNYAQQAYSRIFAQAGLEDEAANLLSRAFAESFDENEYLSKVNSKRFSNWMNGAGSKEALKQQYLDLFGTPADSNLSRKELAKLVAQEQISQEYAGKTKDISDLVAGKAGDDILSLLSGYFGEGFNGKNLASLNWNNEAEIWGILGATGENADELVEGFKELAQVLGIDINLIRDRIKQNAKEQKMRQAEAAFKTSGDLFASGVNAQGITQFLQLDLEDQQIFQNIYSSFDPSFISDKLANAILTGIAQGDEALTSWLKSIDLSNPIQAFKELSTQAQKGTGSIQTVAQELLNAGNASKQFSVSNQLAYLTLSGNYDSLSASLADFIKENGSVSSANILELAEANSDLNALIESNTMSANGLAIALTGIETGTFTILDLTDSVLAAINAMDDLDGVVASIIKELSDFDPGYDENDITSFIGKVYKNASENIENGAYGNNVMGNYMRKIFGDFKWDGTGDYGDAYKEWLNNNLTWLEQNQDNMFSAWDDFVGASDRRILQAGEHQAELLEQNGEIIIHANGATTEELVNAMVEQGHMTETMARMMIADFKNYSADFAHEMGLNDMPNAVEAFAKQISDKGWYLDSELDTLATILGVNRKQIKTELEKYGDFANINLGDQTATDIISALNQIYGNGGNVDLSDRHIISKNDMVEAGWYGFEDGIATTYTGTYTNPDKTVAINFTPILPDGSGILSPATLQKYAEDVIAGVREDDLHLQIGTEFTGEDAVAQAEQAAQNIHHIQSLLYQNGNEKIFDWDGIKQAMDDVDLGGYFETVINDVAQAGDKITARMFGDVRTFSVDAGQTAGQAYAEEYQRAVNENLATQIGTVFKEIFTGLEINIDNENGLVKIKEVQDQLDVVKEGADAPIGATIEPDVINNLDTIIQKLNEINQGATATVTVKNGSTSGSSYPAGYKDGGGIGASGGTVKSFANGSANISLSPGTALTGEEGPEIVWNKKKGYAYITGEDHPEFQDLQPGDRVFNAQETKKILSGAATGGQVPSYARGYGSAPKKTGSGSGSGSGSGGKDKEDEWKNDLDWLYNLMEDIVELERDQKALEEQYEDYLQDQSKTGQDLYKLLIKQLGNLYTQLQHQQFALEKREQEMREFMDVTNDKDQYLWYNWQDRTIEIDWDAIDQITDEDEYKHVKELINEAEEIQDKIDDADDSIMDITNQIQELEHIWRDTYVDFEKRVLDALVKSYQKVIDNYSELNDTLNDSNSQILQSLQKEIDLQRQIRDNTKTEEQIADDEARLAYLRRDTSGGNDLDALQLEKDLNDQRESYTDTLIDQAIQRLQDDNDAAAQQRERQIEIMQAQLDYQSENGEFNAFIRQLMEDAISPDGSLLTDSELYNLLKEQENWDAMSDVNKQVWEEELNNTFKEVVAFLLKENSVENGTFYTAVTAAIEGLTSIIGSYSQSITKLGKSSSGSSGGGSGGGSNGNSGGSSGGGSGGGAYSIGMSKGSTMKAAAQAELKRTRGFGTVADYILRYKKYATGGLATSTGPAWLDGTLSEPEYVLNARQTDAFLKLADVLPSVMGNNSSSGVNNTFGATTFNLSVHVDKIASDYDVDHMCDLIKEKLYDSGSYRNVNSLSFLR